MQSNGLATILLMVPVLTVPALAIFGIPQFAPVVASSLDEGRDKDKESHVGNSANQSHDDLFGDVEDFGSEPPVTEDSYSKRRASSVAGGVNRRGGSRRSDEPSTAAWSDDLSSESDWESKPRRRSPSLDPDESASQKSTTKSRIPKKSLEEKSPRDRRRDEQDIKDNDAIRVASAGDIDQGFVQAGFVDDTDLEKPQSSGETSRSRLGNRNSKRRESVSEPLTWHAAQERLNELDIRNFRLEPSHQLGHFVFICSYTPPDNSRVSYRFEASADEPLKAVEKVLEQIVEWRQKR